MFLEYEKCIAWYLLQNNLDFGGGGIQYLDNKVKTAKNWAKKNIDEKSVDLGSIIKKSVLSGMKYSIMYYCQ